ncbi:MAG: hypothetical protein RML93_03915 [Anaerolineales bacterium]|nr:hypothetical protein [Anaerolineales bacterium]MCS7247340.1 hypothetical protein [Anaerolineales bacterium]MDW8161151.1 hypothetical protein [Anaerolineales bacterium]MDW8446423.1 hypothetical protein [Anaerolineales bacterium]
MTRKLILARILLIEERPNFYAANRTALETAGYEVILARNPREAMERIEGDWPDLLLVELAENRKNEILEFGKRLHRDPILRHLPIVFFASPEGGFSGNLPKEEIHYAAALLPKPCSTQTLLRTLGSVLEQRK